MRQSWFKFEIEDRKSPKVMKVTLYYCNIKITDFWKILLIWKNVTDGEEIKLRHWKKYEDLLVGGEKNTVIIPVGKNLQYDISSVIYYYLLTCAILKRQCHEIFDSRFFHESVFPKPLSIPLVQLKNFSKIHRNISTSRSQYAPLVLLTPVALGKSSQSEKF